jgi:hypothetical protein
MLSLKLNLEHYVNETMNCVFLNQFHGRICNRRRKKKREILGKFQQIAKINVKNKQSNAGQGQGGQVIMENNNVHS